jgi:xylulokinase
MCCSKKSQPWMSIAACLGAAMLGAVATGCFANLEEASTAMVRVKDHLYPNPANAMVYQEGFESYNELYDRLEPMFRK